MAELRWTLLLLGAAFVVGLALWEWRRGRGRSRGSLDLPQREEPRREPVIRDEPVRREPSIDEFKHVDLDATDEFEIPEMLTVAVSDEEAVDVPGVVDAPVDVPATEADALPTPEMDFAEVFEPQVQARPEPLNATREFEVVTDVAEAQPSIRWPPERLPDRVLGLRVAARAGKGLSGQQVRLALQAAGLLHGPQQIFHRVDDDGNVLASVANLLRPGSLNPARMDAQEFRGLSLFSVLPGARPDEQVLEELVQLARLVAGRLGAVVQDEYGQELDAERLTQLRRAVAASTKEHAKDQDAEPS